MSALVPALKLMTPWWAKIGLKIPLARLPITTARWRRVGIFKLGEMTDPAVAERKLAQHVERAGVSAGRPFTLLELGPGDSLLTALIARGVYGCARTISVDVGDYAAVDFDLYSKCAAGIGLPTAGMSTTGELLASVDCAYMTEGLRSLRSLPDRSIDFTISDSVLEHVRRAEFDETVQETYRVLADGGVASHAVDLEDHLSGSLNSLRFSTRRWESRLFADSGFYTNRLRASEVVDSFRRAGFDITLVDPQRWALLPTPRSRMHSDFDHLTDDDLLVSSLHLVATKPTAEPVAAR